MHRALLGGSAHHPSRWGRRVECTGNSDPWGYLAPGAISPYDLTWGDPYDLGDTPQVSLDLEAGVPVTTMLGTRMGSPLQVARSTPLLAPPACLGPQAWRPFMGVPTPTSQVSPLRSGCTKLS